MRTFVFISFATLLIGCGQQNVSSLTPIPNAEQRGENPIVTEPNQLIDQNLNFCSKLEFDGMTVPEGLTLVELNSFALALNISSTFEGKEKWKNITNNFDGQGLSMGLLNQTLGTESLQPLLLEMLQAHKNKMKSQFTSQNFNSLEKMILDWKDARGIKVKNDSLFAEDGEHISGLDESTDFQIFSDAGDASVTWAVQNLYTDTQGRRFKTDWKKQLQSLCMTPEYRSIQLEAARYLHEKATSYFERFQMTEVRSYLFMFDVVVQNGGFYRRNFNEFSDFIKKNPRATETQKLAELLRSRLVQVRAQFKEDVRARKQSLIDGKGKVHGSQRDYEKEFCFTAQSRI